MSGPVTMEMITIMMNEDRSFSTVFYFETDETFTEINGDLSLAEILRSAILIRSFCLRYWMHHL